VTNKPTTPSTVHQDCQECTNLKDGVVLDEAASQDSADLPVNIKVAVPGNGAAKHSFLYQGLARTTTGVVKIMREVGNTEAADLLEEMQLVNTEALRLLDSLRKLSKRKTGLYPKITVDVKEKSDSH